MQTQTEKALCDIARELKEIRKLLEKDCKDQYRISLTNASMKFESISNNPEAHDWRMQDE